MTDASETDTTFVDSLPQLLCREVRKLLAPLTRIAADPDELDRLLASVGASPSDMQRTGLMSSITTVAGLVAQLEALSAQSELTFDSIEQILSLGQQAFAAVRAIDTVVVASPELAGLGQDVAERLFGNYLSRSHPLLRSIGVLTTVIEDSGAIAPRERVIRNNAVVREAFTLDRFRFDRIGRLIRDPLTLLKEEYGASIATTAEATALAQKLFPRLKAFFDAVGLTSRFGFNSGDEDAAPPLIDSLTVHITDVLLGAEADAGVTIVLSPLEQGNLGLVVVPFGALNLNRTFGEWQFTIAVTAGMSTFAYGPQGLMVLDAAATATVGATASALLPPAESGPRFVLGSATGTRLEIGSVEFKAASSFAPESYSLAFDVSASKAAFVIAPGDGDGFLQSILPADGRRVDFDLGLAWSSERGLTLRGSAGLDATLPIGLSIGGVTLSTVHLSLQAREASVLAEVSASLGASIGPVDAAIERVGLVAAVTFPETGGNVGVANLDFRFKPPNGIALVIDAKTVVGGGYLSFDPQKEEYSGIFELRIAERIAVKAIGVLTTRLPDGAKGYSLLILITTEGFAPIPLGLGFTLTGIGGLLAINRTFAEDALRAGLKQHTLDSVLFPHDPLRNAPQIISNLNTVFPPADGHHLFGPMLQIAWGTPPLITAELGLVLEFGARQRLLVLGQVVAILPRRDHELLRLQLDAIGVLDFDQGTAELDATLYDSRLLNRFPLTGDMAMRLRWEGSRHFALAVGGLHPAFRPPPKFPQLARLALDLSRGDNPRLRCEAYFALTSNTVQFGARAELYAAAGFSLHGEIGIDVLIQLAPFHFLADFYAQVQLKRGSTNLFKVRVEGTLEGPLPLHIKGKATFEILWWDVTVRFNATLVGGVTPLLAELIDVLPLLREALVHPGNWRSQLPAGQRPVVTLRATPGAATDVCLHPLGTLTVTQSVVPLNLEITRFGAAVPAGARSFTISSVGLGSLGGQHQTPPSVTDFFARAQFFEMSDAEKLSSPSFEPMAAGFRIGADEFVFSEKPDDWLEVATIAYDTITVDTQTNALRRSTVDTQTNALRRSAPQEPYVLSLGLLGKQARFGAAGRSDLRRTGSAKYRTTRGATYELGPEGWIIVATEDLVPQPAPGIAAGTPVMYSEAVQALRHLHQEDPAKAAGLTMLRLSEWPFSAVPSG